MPKGWSLRRQLVIALLVGAIALVLCAIAAVALFAQLLRSRNTSVGSLRLLMAIAGLAILLVIIGGFTLWIALRRWVIAPLSELGHKSHQVAQGQLDRQVSVDGPQEIANVGGDVEAMRTYLVAALSNALRSQEALRQQTQQLAEQADDLRRSNAELEQFAYVASHDLQEPLRKVASFCQMLERRYKGQLDERADQYIGFAVDGAKRMQHLINDLLAFSRVGRAGGEFQPVDLDTVLALAVRNLESTIEESHAQIEAEPLPTALGNPVLLTQVFQNLIGNAIKFHGDQTPIVRVSAARIDDEWLLRCEDNGIGIEPQYADRIFVIFQRLHTKDAYSGTGIGLALCRKIVEHHGGRIWLESGDSTSQGGKDQPQIQVPREPVFVGRCRCWTNQVLPSIPRAKNQQRPPRIHPRTHRCTTITEPRQRSGNSPPRHLSRSQGRRERRSGQLRRESTVTDANINAHVDLTNDPDASSIRPIEVLLVEDDLGDIMMTREAFADNKVQNTLHVVNDGVEALAFLRKEGAYADAPTPDLVLLDLNLPKMDGREVLASVKNDDELRRIPIVVLTTSESEEDVTRSYDLHANAYVTKPVDFERFTQVVRHVDDFFFSVVKLPPSEH